MNIGQAAKASGVSAKMIHHYEGIGLIQAADRAMSGYRVYGTREVETLRFIRRPATSTSRQDRSRASADVKRFALEHVAILEVRMRDLQEMVGTLKHLASNCHGDDRLTARSSPTFRRGRHRRDRSRIVG